MSLFKNLFEKYSLEFLSLIVFAIYLITMAPGVIQIDSGELAAAACTLGIAHPTGYPTFTLIGYLFTKVLFFFPKITALNIFAAVSTTIGFFFLAKVNIFLFSFENISIHPSKETKQKKKLIHQAKTDEKLVRISAIISALIIAFSKTFWLQSTSVEVYSFHLALITPTIYFFIKAVHSEDEKVKQIGFNIFKNKYWILFPLFLGLSFTNHLTSILVLPAFAILYFQKFGFKPISIKRIFLLLIPFLAAMMFYLYLPITASTNPEINWGNPIDFELFKRHVMGWQYQSWVFSSTESASKQLKYFIENFPIELAYLGVVFFVIGIFTLLKRNRRVFTFAVVLFITCVLYSINYDINDIDSYFLLAYLVSGIFITSSLIFLSEWFSKNIKSFNPVLLFLIPVVVLVINFNKADQRKNVQFQQYAENILQSVEPNAIIISYLWDFYVSPSYYLQHVENFRKDVAVIDKELVRRTWYFNQIKRNYPEIYQNSEYEIEAFIPELLKFERNQNYNGQLLEEYFQKILSSFIVKNISHRPVYIGTEIATNELRNGKFRIPDSLSVVPDLFLFKVTMDKNYHQLRNTDYRIDFMNDNSYYTNTLRNLIAANHVNRALYEQNFGNTEKAKFFVEKALQADSKINIPLQLQKLF